MRQFGSQGRHSLIRRSAPCRRNSDRHCERFAENGWSTQEVAKELAPLIGQTYESLLSKLNTKADTVELARGVTMEAANKIRDLQAIYGVTATRPWNWKPFPPVRNHSSLSFAAFWSAVIGYVNREGRSAYGVEQNRDKDLRGTPGKIHGAVNALRDVIPNDLPGA